MTMDCKRCNEELTAFLDGELSPDDSAEVQSHVANCRLCAQELSGLQEMGDLLDAHTRELDPHVGSWSMIRSRIEQPNSHRFSLQEWGPWRLTAATLALAAIVTFGYLHYRQVQSRDLDRYISQYIQDRETRLQGQPVSLTPTQFEDPYANNPFADVKAVLTDNPFSSEDE